MTQSSYCPCKIVEKTKLDNHVVFHCVALSFAFFFNSGFFIVVFMISKAQVLLNAQDDHFILSFHLMFVVYRKLS